VHHLGRAEIWGRWEDEEVVLAVEDPAPDPVYERLAYEAAQRALDR
jgi:hypothetical protein